MARTWVKSLNSWPAEGGGGEFLDLGVGPRGNHNYEFSFSETYKGLKRKKDIKIQYIFTTWLFLARPRAWNPVPGAMNLIN